MLKNQDNSQVNADMINKRLSVLPVINWLGKPDTAKTDLGFYNLPNVETRLLYKGENTKELGSYAHHAHCWSRCRLAEDSMMFDGKNFAA